MGEVGGNNAVVVEGTDDVEDSVVDVVGDSADVVDDSVDVDEDLSLIHISEPTRR